MINENQSIYNIAILLINEEKGLLFLELQAFVLKSYRSLQKYLEASRLKLNFKHKLLVSFYLSFHIKTRKGIFKQSFMSVFKILL